MTVKRVDKGLVSNYLHDNLKVGDKLLVDPPSGSFYVDKTRDQFSKYVFFARGSGVTPIYSMIQDLLKKPDTKDVVLVYANRDYDSIIFRAALDQLEQQSDGKLKVAHILSQEQRMIASYHYGQVNKSFIKHVFEKYEISTTDTLFMMCGPSGFMTAVKDQLFEREVKPAHIKEEVFSAPKVAFNPKTSLSEVELIVAGTSHKFEMKGNKTILEAAMANDIDVPYACGAGMCVSCKANCVSGKVKMVEGHFLEPHEVEAGKVLTCVSYPESEKNSHILLIE